MMGHVEYFIAIGCSLLLGGLAAIIDAKIGDGKKKKTK